jgi:hypothetical protein
MVEKQFCQALGLLIQPFLSLLPFSLRLDEKRLGRGALSQRRLLRLLDHLFCLARIKSEKFQPLAKIINDLLILDSRPAALASLRLPRRRCRWPGASSGAAWRTGRGHRPGGGRWTGCPTSRPPSGNMRQRPSYGDAFRHPRG